MTTNIARRQTPEEVELEKKKAELSALETELSQRELELATLQAELHAFERRYLRIVGVRYTELDDIAAQIAETLARRKQTDVNAQQQAAEARARAQESAEARCCSTE
jgi:Skp family chaperone for outer membrane proteins